MGNNARHLTDSSHFLKGIQSLGCTLCPLQQLSLRLVRELEFLGFASHQYFCSESVSNQSKDAKEKQSQKRPIGAQKSVDRPLPQIVPRSEFEVFEE